MNKSCYTFKKNLFSDSNQPSATVTFVRVSGTEEGDSPSTSTTNGKNYFLAYQRFLCSYNNKCVFRGVIKLVQVTVAMNELLCWKNAGA